MQRDLNDSRLNVANFFLRKNHLGLFRIIIAVFFCVCVNSCYSTYNFRFALTPRDTLIIEIWGYI